MQRDDLASLVNRLMWGSAGTRQRLAEQLANNGSSRVLAMLAETVRSDAPWRLRARCLEVLGLAAGQAQRELAEHILRLLVGERPETGTDRERG